MCPLGVAGQQVEWSLFPNVDLVDFGPMNTSVNGERIVEGNGAINGRVNGELCGKVNTNANATLNAIPNAEDNGEIKRFCPSLSNVRT